MAKYDYASAKRYIQMHADQIEVALLGMEEDWFWTAEEVFMDGRFIIDLETPNLEIVGIDSSFWATPTLQVNFKDGRVVTKPCFVGEVGGQKPGWFSLGVLSHQVQDERAGRFLESPDSDNS